MQLDRRALLASGAAAAISTPAFAQGGEDERLLAIFDRYFNENVDESPQQATSLGLDTGRRAARVTSSGTARSARTGRSPSAP